jgi:hypothetical protein
LETYFPLKSGELGPFFPGKIFCISQNHNFRVEIWRKFARQRETLGRPGARVPKPLRKRVANRSKKTLFATSAYVHAALLSELKTVTDRLALFCLFPFHALVRCRFCLSRGKEDEGASAPASQRSTDSSALQIIFSAPDLLLLLLLLLPRSSEVLSFFFFFFSVGSR